MNQEYAVCLLDIVPNLATSTRPEFSLSFSFFVLYLWYLTWLHILSHQYCMLFL
jgi:hypothetical protein